MSDVPEQTPAPVPFDPAFDVHPSRRRVLKWMIRASYGAFALAFALPALALRTLSQARKVVAAGDTFVYATGDRSGQPVLATALQPGQAAQAFPKGKEDNQENLVEFVKLSNDPNGLVAYSAICTHLGCTVLGNLDQNGHILCPCHGSLYDPANGAAVLRGPASRPLPSLPISIAADGSIAATGGFSGPVGPQ